MYDRTMFRNKVIEGIFVTDPGLVYDLYLEGGTVLEVWGSSKTKECTLWKDFTPIYKGKFESRLLTHVIRLLGLKIGHVVKIRFDLED